jgi:hypothetical protein
MITSGIADTTVNHTRGSSYRRRGVSSLRLLR